jgi:hypothetical protein
MAVLIGATEMAAGAELTSSGNSLPQPPDLQAKSVCFLTASSWYV